MFSAKEKSNRGLVNRNIFFVTVQGMDLNVWAGKAMLISRDVNCDQSRRSTLNQVRERCMICVMEWDEREVASTHRKWAASP